MTASAGRSRMFTAGGGLLAVAGLAATMAVGPAAFAEDDHQTTANAEVASTITLTGDAEFTLSGAPGDEDTTTSALTAETNNIGGYDVTVLADQEFLLPEDTVANVDDIPVSSVEVENTEEGFTELSTTVPVTVHSQDERSAEGGDALVASYQLTMPFVNADTYSGGLTFTAAAN